MPDLETTMNRQLVKWAAGHKISCDGCGRILDASSTVVYTGQASRAVSCGTCWDENLEAAARKKGLTTAKVVELLTEHDASAILDGRKI